METRNLGIRMSLKLPIQNRYIKYLLIFFFLCLTLSGHAQSLVIGEIQDAFLKTPLIGAKLSLLTADSTVVRDSIPLKITKNSSGRVKKVSFIIPMAQKTCKYLLRATLKNYDNGWATVNINKDERRAWYMDMPIYLRRNFDTQLSEATVTATRLKVYYRGDTLVYDAQAFKLPDGSMLDELVRQLPGVTMNDNGEIFVNGRKVEELLLGARSFFGGKKSVMLQNLPYYTVKELKVYEQESDLARASGNKSLPKKYVMDVQLKDEFSRGYIGNVEAAGGTKERWLGRGFLLGFADKYRLSLTANSNNVNEKRHIGEGGHWTPDLMPRSLQTIHSVAGDVDYESDNHNLKNNLNFEFFSNEDKGETRQRQELFLDGSTPFSLSHSATTHTENKWSLKNKFKLIQPQKLYQDASFNMNYKTFKGSSAFLSEQYTDSLNHRLTSGGFSEGHAFSMNLQGTTLSHVGLLKGISFWYNIDHAFEKNKSARQFTTEQMVNPLKTQTNNSNDYLRRNTHAMMQISRDEISLGHKNFLDIDNQYHFIYNKAHDWLYHPDSLLLPSQIDALQAMTDPRNSYTSNLTTNSNTLTISLRGRQQRVKTPLDESDYDLWKISLWTTFRHQKLDFQRGAIDTVTTQKEITFSPRFYFYYYPKHLIGKCLKVSAWYAYNKPYIEDLINYIDDATPLVVKLGNPDLKNIGHTHVTLQYTDWQNKRRGRQYNVQSEFVYHHRDVAQSVTYSPESGIYTYQPKNVSGAWYLNGSFSYSCPIDKNQHWTWQTMFYADYNHSVDHSMLEGETESKAHAVNTLMLKDSGWIQYQKNALSLRLSGNIGWRHSEGNMRDFSTLSAFDYNYGLNGRYTIPRINTTVSCDAKMYSRRGYGSSALNTDDFVLNASLSQSFLKGKLIARVEGFDLLHQLSTTNYIVNAQGRTETWYRSLPRYVMFHLVYHWNKNPKKG